MKFLPIALLFALIPSLVFAQAGGGASGVGVRTSGTITAGHCAQFLAVNVIQDSGGACGGGGGSVSITAGSTNIIVSPSPLTGTGTVNLGTSIAITGTATFGGGASIGTTAVAANSLKIAGATSGVVTLVPLGTAGTPTLTFGTSSGTPVVTASSPLAIAAATGNITCATCGTSSLTLGGASTNVQFNSGGTALGGDSGFTYGSGLVTIGTSLTVPTVIGGTGTSSTLALESTSGSGATDSIIFKTGSQTTELTIGTNFFNVASASQGIQLGGANGISYPSVDSTTDGTIAIGSQAFANPSTSAAYHATVIGYDALSGSLSTAAVGNTAVGYQAGLSNTTGSNNTYFGLGATGPTTGSNNTIIGAGASTINTLSGSTALGENAQASGANDVAIGFGSKTGNGGFGNLAVGIGQNVGAYDSEVIIGGGAGVKSRTTGTGSIAIGINAMNAITTASNNVVIGENSGTKITTGSTNVILGPVVASTTLNTGSNNILIGTNSGVDAAAAGTSNSLDIGNLIYGVGLGTSGTIPAGQVGIGTNNPRTGVSFDLGTETNSMLLPVGTTGQEPTGIAGMLRYNSTLTLAEGYIHGIWANILSGSNGTPTCGTGCASINAGSLDSRGSMVSSSSVSAITLNFSTTLPSVPVCTISDSNNSAVSDISSITTSALNVSLASALSAVTIYYICAQ